MYKAKALQIEKFAYIGRMNYFGTHARNVNGLFNECKKVYVFDRMIDYRTPYREDGLFHLGALVTAWFVWERGFIGKPTIEQIDMQKYAKLGSYEIKCQCGTKLTKYEQTCPYCHCQNEKFIGNK